jgi:hypothetical protein
MDGTNKLKKVARLVGMAGRKIVLHPGEALLFCRMATWVMTLSLLAKTTSLTRALQTVSTHVRKHPVANISETGTKLANTIDLLLATDVLWFRPSCWKRATILHRYLALNGIDSRIIFGMRKEPDGQLAGHAWVESDGEPTLEKQSPAYTVTFRFPIENTSATNTSQTLGSLLPGEPQT